MTRGRKPRYEDVAESYHAEPTSPAAAHVASLRDAVDDRRDIEILFGERDYRLDEQIAAYEPLGASVWPWKLTDGR